MKLLNPQQHAGKQEPPPFTICSVFKPFRNHLWFFWTSTVVAVALRLYFGLTKWSRFDGDALYYGKIAACIATQRVYGTLHGDTCASTMIRLPGYPGFLAAVYSVFGVGNYRAVLLIQAAVDLLTCFIIADIARRIAGDRVARWTYAVAAVCPFLANYAGAQLTECLEVFFTALAIDFAIIAFDAYVPGESTRRSLKYWAFCGAAIACAILLRPDGGLLLGSIGLVMIWQMFRSKQWRHYIAAGIVTAGVALSPLVPWGIRNYRVFHVFQPLVNLSATDPGEFEPYGFDAWCQNWMWDYSSTEDLTFVVPGDKFDLNVVPNRAYTDDAERQQVARLVAEYNKEDNGYDMTPALDAEFAKIAQRHKHEQPFRIKVVYPAIRMFAMWFRPRTEMLPCDTHWWRYKEDPHDFKYALTLAALNALFVVGAIIGAIKGRKELRYLALLLTFPFVRCAMLWYLRTVEDRYTLECYPIVLVLAGYFVATCVFKKKETAVATVVGSATTAKP
jgi:4-amino-4-deoxy-L-arabinose transferase-like glycosyltransferase